MVILHQFMLVAKGAGYLLAIAVKHRLLLSQTCTRFVPCCCLGPILCGITSPPTPTRSCQHENLLHRPGQEISKGKIPIFKSNDGDTLIQTAITRAGASQLHALQNVIGTGLQRGQIGNKPTNILNNLLFPSENIPQIPSFTR